MRVALVHRNSPRLMDKRMVGWWSYDVPEFEVTHYPVDKRFSLNKNDLAKKHDLIFYEDGKIGGEFTGSANIPIVYLVVDSTLSEQHYFHRLNQAEQADLILVDWDKLKRFTLLDKPVRRFSYCVNDQLFHNRNLEKSIDICSMQNRTPERNELNEWLNKFCKDQGYSLVSDRRMGKEYAETMSKSKLVINLNRNLETRGHRIFDGMASYSCVVTSPTPNVSREPRRAGEHYIEFTDCDSLTANIRFLLSSGWWERIAQNASALVQEHYTWSVRAWQLHQMVTELFFDEPVYQSVK